MRTTLATQAISYYFKMKTEILQQDIAKIHKMRHHVCLDKSVALECQPQSDKLVSFKLSPELRDPIRSRLAAYLDIEPWRPLKWA
jgi:hypothetical protein